MTYRVFLVDYNVHLFGGYGGLFFWKHYTVHGNVQPGKVSVANSISTYISM